MLLAQLRRLEWIVKTRQKLGDMLVELLADLPGVHPPERKEGVEAVHEVTAERSEHSYWNFPIRIDEEVLGVSPDKFSEAVRAEGAPMGGAWIGKPLYLFEALAQQITYGSSHCPFDCPRHGKKVECGAGDETIAHYRAEREMERGRCARCGESRSQGC